MIRKRNMLRLLVVMILGASSIAPTGWSSVMTYLKVTPLEDFESSGNMGGPFTPASKDYQLKNTDIYSLYWGVDVTVSWLDVGPEPGWGLLDPNETVVVTVSLNSIADTLGGGIHTDTITFTDMTNDEEETRGVSLTITAPPGELEITPVEDFASSGEPGGPFTPPSKDYQLKNIGGSTLDWGVSKTVDWLDLGPETWGDLDPNETTIVTVSLNSNADLLGEGDHTDTVTFTDIPNLVHTRGVTLSIVHIGGLWIDPESFDVEVTEGTTLEEVLTIGNDGVEDVDFEIRTRVVGVSGQSAGEKSGIFSIPEGHDFTVAGVGAYKPGELIVRFAPRGDGKSASPADKQQILESLGGGTIRRDFNLVPGLSLIELPEGMTVQEALQQFNNTDGILYAEPNYEIKLLSRIPNDTRFDELWGMHNMGQTGGTVDADIDAPEAWDLATGSSSVIVALLDTGVDYNHIDLAANMWVNSGEIPGNGQDDDGNGYVDDVYGWDFADGDADPMDYQYHGTHCAGTIGGMGNNNEGVAGVCWDVTIMSLKVFPNYGETGFIAGAIAAIEYAVDNGAQLTSNSWGGGPYSQGLKDAINDAGAGGLLFVAAAGNDYGQDNDVYPHYPSSYDCDSVIAVLSTDDEDDMSSFSNYGPASVDLGAPGSDILSCEPGNQYQYLDGTSMATPHVAGACALLWSVNPMLTNTEVKEILLDTVDPTLGGLCVSGGRLNLYNAILETSAPWLEIEPEEGVVGPGDTNDISVTFDAMTLAPGVYEAEIIVASDDPVRPTITIPVTMMVAADALQATPADDFESSGVKGGPFSPACKSYTLSNEGDEAVSWTSSETPDWLSVSPVDGVLDPNGFVVVDVCIDPNANLLEPGLYIETLVFTNEDSGSIKVRTVSLTVLPPDIFTESFDEEDNDLSYTMLTFRPDGSSAYYAACEESTQATIFPTDPNGGTYVALWDDDFVEVVLNDGAEVSLYGQSYDRLYIGSNGYITFGDGDTEWLETLENHFSLPRISAMFVDLAPPDGECISYKQLDDSIVVTFEDVPLYGDKDAVNSFQVQIFFADETIWITYLDLVAEEGIAGLSEGAGVPAFYVESDLSEYIECCVCGDFNGDGCINLVDFGVVWANWLRDDCVGFDWCERTDIDRSGDVGAEDVSQVAPNWLIGPETGYGWSRPSLHDELNDGENGAFHSCLSSDSLTMYFSRYIPSLGHICVVEAYRDTPDEPFTSERVLTELVTTGDKVRAPWISDDELRLYYKEVPDGFKMAERSSVGDTWEVVKTFNELNGGGATLTADELTIVFHSDSPSCAGGKDLWMATRTEPNGVFGDLRCLDEINTSENDMQPALLADGLTLYFDRGYGTPDLNIYKATRSSRSEPFGNIEYVGVNTDTYHEGDMHVTADDNTIYFWSDRGVDGVGIWVSEWEPVPDYEWSEPSLHDELNDGENGAGHSCLSSDGLTMYFSRLIPSLGHICVVEAYRDTPDGPFTSERVLTELCTTGNKVRAPWISDDQLRLYYGEVPDFKMAERSSVGDTWEVVKTFNELNGGGATLTADELTIVFHSDSPSCAGGKDLWMATRTEPNGVFGDLRCLDEINTSENDMQPALLPDGLTLYFDRGYGTPNWDIYKATRSSLNEPFGNIEHVGFNTGAYYEYSAHVTPDEKTIYFNSDRGVGIWVSHQERIINYCLPR